MTIWEQAEQNDQEGIEAFRRIMNVADDPNGIIQAHGWLECLWYLRDNHREYIESKLIMERLR